VSLVGSVGEDDSGNELINLVQAAGINSEIIIKPNATTTRKTRIVAGLQQVTRVDFECSPGEHFHQDFLPFESLICDADIVVVSDYAKGFVHHARKIIEIANRLNKRVLIDPKIRNYSNYSGASLLTPNYKEFEHMVGFCRNADEVEAKAHEVIERLNLECLVLTRGSDGMTLFQGTKSYSIPAVAKEVFDVSGAGDTVIAALTLGLSVGMSFMDAVMFANKCASIAVSKFGTASVTLDDLEI
jgi:rfaE bifunctional protein kinase chain/domain